MYSHCLVSVRREEAVTMIALNDLPLATVTSHCALKMLQSLCVLQRVCWRACVLFAVLQEQMRGRASLKCFVDLVIFFPVLPLWLRLRPFVSPCSTTLKQSGNDSFHWVFSFNGRCSLSVLRPKSFHGFTLVIAPCFATHVSFLSTAFIGVSTSFIC